MAQENKRILIFTNHYSPESFRVNDVAMEMSKRGHKVKVITGIPDYPEGHYHKGYSLFKRRVETVDGIDIVRVPIIPRGNGKALRLALNYLSGIVSFFVYGVYQALFHRYDCIFVHDTSPAFISIPAWIVSKLRGTPIYHWILDMWPESLTAGGINNPTLYSLITKMMKMFYRNDRAILITSLGFRQMLTSRGVPNEKIIYLPNWGDDAITRKIECNLPAMPEGFKIMFAGNLGEAQNLENVLEAARLTKNHKHIHWLIVGDGRKKPWVDEFIKTHHLAETVHPLGRFPIEMMSSFFEKADVMLVSLKNTPVFNMTLPAKVQAYMANGKPILGMMNGEGAYIINKAQCGWCIDADSPELMAKKVIEISSIDASQLTKYGQNGLNYYNSNFTKTICMDRLEAALTEITQK